jgi:hypothetical protein
MNDPAVGFNRLVASDTYYFLFLQHPQQLCLQIRIHFSDLIQEKCSAACFLKASYPSEGGSCEGSLLMAEELAFNKLIWNSRDIYGDKGLFAPFRIVVDCLGYQLLPGSGLSGDYYSDVCLLLPYLSVHEQFLMAALSPRMVLHKVYFSELPS